MNLNLNKNVGQIDQYVRIGGGGLLTFLALMGVVGPWGWIGVLPLATGVMGSCPAYNLLGINTKTAAAETPTTAESGVVEETAVAPAAATEAAETVAVTDETAPVAEAVAEAEEAAPVAEAVAETEETAPVAEAVAEAEEAAPAVESEVLAESSESTTEDKTA